METKKKYGIAAVIAAFALSGGIVANAQNKTVTNAELPATAQAFIKQHFPGTTIRSSIMDKEVIETDYNVILSNGIEIEFDGNGNWEEIDGNHVALPVTVLPKGIADYTTQHYAGKAVVQIDKDKKGFDVELADNTELEFDANGKFIRIDN